MYSRRFLPGIAGLINCPGCRQSRENYRECGDVWLPNLVNAISLGIDLVRIVSQHCRVGWFSYQTSYCQRFILSAFLQNADDKAFVRACSKVRRPSTLRV